MKRDWDVIRDVLLEVEALSEDERQDFEYSPDADADTLRRVRGEHALLLWKGQFIEALDTSTLDGRAIMAPALTWQGHELLDTLRSQPVWDRIKVVAKDKGVELTFDALKALSKIALDWVLRN